MFECANRGSLCDGTCEGCPATQDKVRKRLEDLAEERGLPLNHAITELAAGELAKSEQKMRRDANRLFMVTALATGAIPEDDT